MFSFWRKKKEIKHRCEICHKQFSSKDLIKINKIGPSLIAMLKQEVPHYNPKGTVCLRDLRQMRVQQIRLLFEQQEGDFGNLEQILFQEGDRYPYSFNQEYQNELSLGERLSQKITPLLGNWGFVAVFLAFVFLWIGYNSQEEFREHFDPFPFIFLNLLLSCMAAIQAPIIMMAQNRLAKRDRLRADEDYYTNLKAELEIRQLHAKIDAFLNYQKKEKI